MSCTTTMSNQQLIDRLEEEQVQFIQLWFTDILGLLKSFSITRDEMPEALSEGMGFDGSSIQGFARIEESDMIAMPDTATFAMLTWNNNGYKEARMFCDVLTPHKESYEGDPRYVLKKVLKRCSDLGYISYVGPELEFFLFKDSKSPETLDQGGYFDTQLLDIGGEVRNDCVVALQNMGIQVEYSHHEVAPSQHEIDLRYDGTLRMADKTMTYRAVIKEVARKWGAFASFMPKPLYGVNGSGMHTHQSLFRGDENLFHDPNDQYYLSSTAKHYLAGILHHAREITAITNQWVNSYKRLVPGYEAPVYIAWARRNRSAMIRVPLYKPGKAKATRIEYRSPDPACNPYLAFAVMIAAGLEGIEKGYEMPAPVETDIFKMTPKEREKAGIRSLPGNLFEAIQEMEKSELLYRVLGPHIFNKFIENKKWEWDQYSSHVSQHELQRYYSLL